MNHFLYGMWCMWFILCVYAWEAVTVNGYLSFATIAVLLPGLVVMVLRGLWLLVKFKWEKRA